MTILEARNCSFLDIHHFLVDERRRKAILANVTNPDLLQYWNVTYPAMPKDSAQTWLPCEALVPDTWKGFQSVGYWNETL